MNIIKEDGKEVQEGGFIIERYISDPSETKPEDIITELSRKIKF
jgi:effector-binding domain-containing protein